MNAAEKFLEKEFPSSAKSAVLGRAFALKVAEAYAASETARADRAEIENSELRRAIAHKDSYFTNAALEVVTANERADRLDKLVMEWENREANVCPEDVGFEEIIRILRAEIQRKDEALREVMRVVEKYGIFTNYRDTDGEIGKAIDAGRAALAPISGPEAPQWQDFHRAFWQWKVSRRRR